ncbi:hypothetical protein M378DRAFT_8062 [Amanita muscaria Koide BX008]|uniref:Uncharacterized protein n=1 Tax=Amanita muscaria (strain Koide BX008) TaxID=946122 RepID=A0A0C2XIV5_AMAMK|nr:hypothetical protein M378DRAFT_8062 [Amanita muscaria Koide BX008]
MIVNHLAETIFGTMGTICWTIQLIPQIWKNWRQGSTDGLSPWLMLIWGISGVTLGTYTVLQNLNIPLIIQAHLFAFLAFISWGQCQYYGRGRSKIFATMLTLTTMAIAGGSEVGVVYGIRMSNQTRNNSVALFFGISPTVIAAVGLLPQYWEIYKCGEVIGISTLFVLIDMLGGVFSDLSLVFKGRVDLLAALTYTLFVVGDGAILLLALILNPRAARRREQERREMPRANRITSQEPGTPSGQ